MCIIVYKPIGEELPDYNILAGCAADNPDGAGYMYRSDNGKIIISKGFFDIDELIFEIEKLGNVKDKDIAIHFRYATHGSISPGNCHPFPITKNIRTLRRKNLVCQSAIMHNGVISGMDHKNKTLSDTMCAVKIISDTGEKSQPSLKILSSGKFLIMDSLETRMYGDFINDDGIFYSNNGYYLYKYWDEWEKDDIEMDTWDKWESYWDLQESEKDDLSDEEVFDRYMCEKKALFSDMDRDEIEEMWHKRHSYFGNIYQ